MARLVSALAANGSVFALVAAVIASAVLPTVIANAFFMPRHLLKDAASAAQPAKLESPSAAVARAKRGAQP